MAEDTARALCAGFEQAVRAGLEARRAPLEALFSRLGAARLPDAVDHIHVEVFVGELCERFPAMIFFMEGNTENFEKPVQIGLHDDIEAPLRAFVPRRRSFWQNLTGR